MTEPVYDYICSIGELVDKLSIENIKCHYANTAIIAERKKDKPNAERIAGLELKARTAGEQRVRLRDEINKRLSEAVRRGGFDSSSDVRTYEMK